MYQKLSYLSGTSDKPLIGLTIGEMFDRACLQYADKEAIVSVHQNIRLTYKELADKVNAFAASLIELGFDTGDRLGGLGIKQCRMAHHAVRLLQDRRDLGQSKPCL